MTLLHFDGFDSYNNGNDLATRWGAVAADSEFIFGTVGRTGVGLCLGTQDDWGKLTATMTAGNVFFIGFAWQSTTNFPNFPTNGKIFTLWDAGVEQCGVSINGTKQLQFNRAGTPVGGAGATILSPDKWYYIEIKFTISNSTGANDCIIRINGVNDLVLGTGLDIQNTANSSADVFAIGLNQSNQIAFVFWDDLYVCDDAGSAPYNTFLGDCRVDTIRPNGNGTTSDFLGSDADSTDNYLHVDEVLPDGDTSYVESLTVGHIDLYTLESLPVTPGTIFGVQAVAIAKKDDAGARTGNHVLRTGATNYTGTAFAPSIGSYLGFESIWEENPNTAVPWVNADITGLEAGIKVET